MKLVVFEAAKEGSKESRFEDVTDQEPSALDPGNKEAPKSMALELMLPLFRGQF